jgi:hypothetical protein
MLSHVRPAREVKFGRFMLEFGSLPGSDVLDQPHWNLSSCVYWSARRVVFAPHA